MESPSVAAADLPVAATPTIMPFLLLHCKKGPIKGEVVWEFSIDWSQEGGEWSELELRWIVVDRTDVRSAFNSLCLNKHQKSDKNTSFASVHTLLPYLDSRSQARRRML